MYRPRFRYQVSSAVKQIVEFSWLYWENKLHVHVHVVTNIHSQGHIHTCTQGGVLNPISTTMANDYVFPATLPSLTHSPEFR